MIETVRKARKVEILAQRISQFLERNVGQTYTTKELQRRFTFNEDWGARQVRAAIQLLVREGTPVIGTNEGVRYSESPAEILGVAAKLRTQSFSLRDRATKLEGMAMRMVQTRAASGASLS